MTRICDHRNRPVLITTVSPETKERLKYLKKHGIPSSRVIDEEMPAQGQACQEGDSPEKYSETQLSNQCKEKAGEMLGGGQTYLGGFSDENKIW